MCKVILPKGWYSSSVDYKTCAFCIDNPVLSCLKILGFAMYFYNLLLGQYSEKSWYVLIQVMFASDFFKFWRLFLILYVSFDVFGFRKYFGVSLTQAVKDSTIMSTERGSENSSFNHQQKVDKNLMQNMSSLHQFQRKWRNIVSNLIEKSVFAENDYLFARWYFYRIMIKKLLWLCCNSIGTDFLENSFYDNEHKWWVAWITFIWTIDDWFLVQ